MNDFTVLVNDFSEKLSADIIFYQDYIHAKGVKQVSQITKNTSKKNVLLIIKTLGGDPNSAFKIARLLQAKYSKFMVLVFDVCKSAGTLLALGSDEIIMSEIGEFGPLDIQLHYADEIRTSSGLNITKTLDTFKIETKSLFWELLQEATRGTKISIKTAAEIASKLALGFYNPIVGQIDPVTMGETNRTIKIAMAYGERLIEDPARGNSTYAQIVRMIQDYPNHEFVIDFKESLKLFKCVRKWNDLEEKLVENMIQCHGDNPVIVKY